MDAVAVDAEIDSSDGATPTNLCLRRFMDDSR